jgi:hypothetical protein
MKRIGPFVFLNREDRFTLKIALGLAATVLEEEGVNYSKAGIVVEASVGSESLREAARMNEMFLNL